MILVTILPAWLGRLLALGGREYRSVQSPARPRIRCAGVWLNVEAR